MHSYVAEARDNIRCDPLFGITWRGNVSGTSCKLLYEDVTTYQEQPARYLKRSFQRIRNILQVTWRRCSNVSGTSGKLLQEDVTTYQEHLASYLKKMLQRSRHVLHVTWRRDDKVSGMSWKLLEEDVTTYQERLASDLTEMLEHIKNVLQVTWRKCYAVSGMSCKLLQEDVTTYQERLASHLTEMLRRSRNVLSVCAQEHERYYPTPPHPTGNWSWKNSAVPTDHERIVQCLCLQDSKKMMRLLCLCLHRNMNVITPPHPTPLHR